MSEHRNKTIQGFVWSAIQKIGATSLSFIVMIILARLLSPSDFGLVAMLSIFIQISERIVESGLGQALIQKKNIDETDYSSVFFLNVAISLILYILLFLCAPLIGTFFKQDALVSLLRVMSCVFVINSFSLVQETKIKKELAFKKLTIIQIPSTIIGGIVSILMAYNSLGVWSIVGLQISTRLAYSIQLWIYSNWIPTWEFNVERIRILFGFGGRMLLSTIITAVYNNILTIIIGKNYAVSQVGFYQNAKTLAMTPSTTIKSIADSVTFPSFSLLQNENKKLKQAYKKVMRVLVFWMLPLFVFSAIVGNSIIEFILGEKWNPSTIYFQLLCCIAILSPLVNYNLNILKIKGEAGLFLKVQIYRRVITLIALSVSLIYSFGIIGLLFVECLSYFLSFIIFGHIAGRLIGYNLKEQILDKTSTLILTGSVSCLLYFLNSRLSLESDLLIILLTFLIGFGFYFLVAFFFKFNAFKESWFVIKSFIKKPGR